MKKVLLATILCVAAISYGQVGGATSNSPAPTAGAYDPHPNPAMMDAAPPFYSKPSDVFMRDPKLADKLQKLLPEGQTIRDFCDGFKELGECVTTIHVSQNLGISLTDLKPKVTGKGAEKLEKAVHELKPDADAKAETKKAHKQAEKEIPVTN